MSLSDLASLGSFVSGIAVLVSLIFLFFQIRQVGHQVAQTERNQQASIRQGRADRTVAIAMGAADAGLADALSKAFAGTPDITPTQMVQFSRFCDAVFHGHEDSFYQNQDGLLADSAFAAVVNRLGWMLRVPAFRVLWKRQRTFYAAEFVEFVDRLMARTPIDPLSFVYDPAEWPTALAAERSGAPS